MPLTSKKYTGAIVANYFDNLLPDSVNVRNKLQAIFQINSSSTFDLLSAMGGDCVGALQLLPVPKPKRFKQIDARPLSRTAIEKRLKDILVHPLGLREGDQFRISLAGAQSKTAFLKLKNRWYLPQGATPTSHIFKLPMGKIRDDTIDLSESVENEYLCQLILNELDVPVAKSEIRKFGSMKALVVERFDRQWSRDKSWLMRLPQEDMCQVYKLPSSKKYEDDGGPGIRKIMNLLAKSQHAVKDRQIFMKTQFIFWLMAAIDGHAKNFSIFLKQGNRFGLTPIYDVISAHPYLSPHLPVQQIEMAMALWGKNRHYRFQHILPRHFISTAKDVRFSVQEMRKIINEVCDKMPAALDTIGNRLPKGFPGKISGPIFKGIHKTLNKVDFTKL